jgi:tRNA pseudouridine55 synthase
MIKEYTAEEIKEGQVFLFDKPYKWTSFMLVNKVRWLLCRKHGWKKLKVGHAGTLDPLATGLMILCVGKATKTIAELTGYDKEYIAEIKFGATTPSFDLETEEDETLPFEHINEEQIKKGIEAFMGEIEQVPPLFSAKYVNGIRAYHLARQGIQAELKASNVTIHEFELIDYKKPFGTFRISCSKGTYIRSLARDLGLELNSGAHLTSLKRTKIGDFKLVDTISIEDFEKSINLM